MLCIQNDTADTDFGYVERGVTSIFGLREKLLSEFLIVIVFNGRCGLVSDIHRDIVDSRHPVAMKQRPVPCFASYMLLVLILIFLKRISMWFPGWICRPMCPSIPTLRL